MIRRILINPAALGALARGDIENAITASTPGGIEAQEAAGQATLVAGPWFPKDMMGVTRQELEGLGFKFGSDVDDLFVSAQFPTGWKKVATDHSMWSDIVDDKGCVRGSIFYKAAFYDRKAHLSWNRT